jgi:hypothetical protein
VGPKVSECKQDRSKVSSELSHNKVFGVQRLLDPGVSDSARPKQ